MAAARASRIASSRSSPSAVIVTSTARASAGSLRRSASPARSSRPTSVVIVGWATTSASASAVIRCGPPSRSVASTDAAVRLSSWR